MEAMKSESSISAYEADSPRAPIDRYMERLDKTLCEAHDRAERLDARFGPALAPRTPQESVDATAVLREMQSPLADRLLSLIGQAERLVVVLADLGDRSEL